MKVSEEVDALITIGLNPTKFLVIPKLLAIVIMQPCLTLISDVVSMIGGMLIGVIFLKVEWLRYVRQTRDALLFQDIVTGLIKATVFAIVIAIVGCYEGFQVEGGAEGVGIHTTASVVKSIFFIMPCSPKGSPWSDMKIINVFSISPHSSIFLRSKPVHLSTMVMVPAYCERTCCISSIVQSLVCPPPHVMRGPL